LQDAHVGQWWWFSGEGEATNVGIENVLQTCLAISEIERKREREREKERERGEKEVRIGRMTAANQ